MKLKLFSALFLASISMSAAATIRTVDLSVPGMNCATCPITVKLALTQVAGVSEVSVDYPNRRAMVTYEDTLVSVDALIKATTNAGYPSELISRPTKDKSGGFPDAR